MIEMIELVDLEHTIAAPYLSQYSYPWEVLQGLSDYIIELGQTLSTKEYKEVSQHVWIHTTATIAESASITGPCIVGPHTELRQCAFIRGSAIIGEHCVVGNSTELKNVILFDYVQTPHYNYVGDSILGYYAHMGAGSITSNVKADKSLVTIKDAHDYYDTNRKKVGAVLGDYVEIGCNSVLNPGTVIGRNTSVYPLTSVRGVIESNCIVKDSNTVVSRSN